MQQDVRNQSYMRDPVFYRCTGCLEASSAPNKAAQGTGNHKRGAKNSMLPIYQYPEQTCFLQGTGNQKWGAKNSMLPIYQYPVYIREW